MDRSTRARPRARSSRPTARRRDHRPRIGRASGCPGADRRTRRAAPRVDVGSAPAPAAPGRSCRRRRSSAAGPRSCCPPTPSSRRSIRRIRAPGRSCGAAPRSSLHRRWSGRSPSTSARRRERAAQVDDVVITRIDGRDVESFDVARPGERGLHHGPTSVVGAVDHRTRRRRRGAREVHPARLTRRLLERLEQRAFDAPDQLVGGACVVGAVHASYRRRPARDERRHAQHGNRRAAREVVEIDDVEPIESCHALDATAITRDAHEAVVKTDVDARLCVERERRIELPGVLERSLAEPAEALPSIAAHEESEGVAKHDRRAARPRADEHVLRGRVASVRVGSSGHAREGAACEQSEGDASHLEVACAQGDGSRRTRIPCGSAISSPFESRFDTSSTRSS
jgi:hypothetical protein